MSVSVVIPAHNEASVIGRCLAAITEGARPDELEIVVVCNGCTDDTAAIARQFGTPVRVVETDVASKSHALNLGDREAVGFPRFYVDADVVLPFSAVRAVADVLESGAALAAAPQMRLNVEGCSWFVKAFCSVWLRLPYHQQGMIGSGVYALSRAGRKRFTEFAPITADDAFVRLHFRPNDRAVVQGASFTVTPPRTLGRLIAIKTRAHFGNLELKLRYPELWHNEDVDHQGGLLRLARDIRSWPAIAIYVMVRLLSRWKAWARLRHGDYRTWERDETSRQPVSASERIGV